MLILNIIHILLNFLLELSYLKSLIKSLNIYRSQIEFLIGQVLLNLLLQLEKKQGQYVAFSSSNTDSASRFE